jgi:GntR family transcriptional regulator
VDAQLFLSASDPRPMYQQIVDQVTAKVMAGDWTAGQSLPSIRELAAASGISVITVRRAYEELERAGVIATRQGKGSVVADRGDLPTVLMHQALQQQLDALLACAARLGLPRIELLRLVERAPDPKPDNAPAPGADVDTRTQPKSAAITPSAPDTAPAPGLDIDTGTQPDAGASTRSASHTGNKPTPAPDAEQGEAPTPDPGATPAPNTTPGSKTP